MTLKEFESIKHLKYRDYCANRQQANGMPSVDYGKYASNTGKYGKPGHECHHIAEDLESNLCEKVSELPHLQTPNQLVFLDNEEHLWAHLLISSEVLLKDSTSERCEDLSKGGIGWILSTRTMNKKVVAKMLAEYCNKITTQLVYERDNSTETFEAVKKAYGITDQELIELVKADLRDNICFEHNRQAYADVTSRLLTAPSCIVRICTSGGKTPFGLEYMHENRAPGKKFLVVVHSDQIYDQWDKDVAENDKKYGTNYREDYDVKMIQTLSRDENWLKTEKVNWSDYCGINVDEVQHINEDAETWNKPIKYALSLGLKVLGMTATVPDSQSKDTDEIFGGRIVDGLDIVSGIDQGILWPYNYISSIYSVKGLPEKYNLLNDKLDLFLKDHKVSDTIIKHETRMNRKGQKKGIIFVASNRNIPDEEKGDYLAQFKRARDLVKPAYPEADFYFISSNQTEKENDEAKNKFKAEKEKDCFLVSFGMVNEGAHYEGINTLIMFRTTHSEIVFTQQLGRIMRLVAKCPENPNLAVFDFTNNAVTLLNEAESEHETWEFNGHRNTTPRPEEYLQKYVEGLGIIVECEASDIVEYLKAIRATKDQSRENDMFSETLKEIDISEVNVSDMFEVDAVDLWEGIDVEVKGTTEINPVPTAPKDTTEVVAPPANTTTTNPGEETVVPPSNSKPKGKSKKLRNKQEVFVYVSKFTFDRAVLAGVFRLAGKLEVVDQELLTALCKVAGLKAEGFSKLINADRLLKYWEMRYELTLKSL